MKKGDALVLLSTRLPAGDCALHSSVVSSVFCSHLYLIFNNSSVCECECVCVLFWIWILQGNLVCTVVYTVHELLYHICLGLDFISLLLTLNFPRFLFFFFYIYKILLFVLFTESFVCTWIHLWTNLNIITCKNVVPVQVLIVFFPFFLFSFNLAAWVEEEKSKEYLVTGYFHGPTMQHDGYSVGVGVSTHCWNV